MSATTIAPAWRRAIVRMIAGQAERHAVAKGRVALVKLDRLGDFVLAISAIRLVLQSQEPGASLFVLSPQAAPLATLVFPQVERYVLPSSLGHGRAVLAALRHRGALRRLGISKTICFRHQRWDYDELMLTWTGASVHLRVENDFTRRLEPRRRAFALPQAGGIAWTAGANPADSGLCRELERHRVLVQAATGSMPSADAIKPNLGDSDDVQGGVLVSPLASEEIRDIPRGLLGEALEELNLLGIGPVNLAGTREQRPRLESLVRSLPERVRMGLDIVTNDGLESFVARVGAARLVITADTATAHLACAMDRPAVICLGGGHYGEFGPWHRSERQVWLTEPVDCFGCNWQCVHPEPYCLTRIGSQRLRAGIRHALGHGRVS